MGNDLLGYLIDNNESILCECLIMNLQEIDFFGRMEDMRDDEISLKKEDFVERDERCAVSGGKCVQREKVSKTAGSFVEEKLSMSGFFNPLKDEGEEEKGGRRGWRVPW
ncbi:hypothetical protein LXL04_024143 [Taraxacum kok-saghyz]